MVDFPPKSKNATAVTAQTDFIVGDWLVRPELNRIEHSGKKVHIKPKAMAVLGCLANADGSVVSRNTLFDSVWPGGVVTDDALTQCIVELRKAFGDSAREPRFIETVPKQGFRLIPPVIPLDKASEPDRTGPQRLSTKVPALVGLLLLALTLATYVWMRPPERRPVVEITDDSSLAVMPFVDMSPKQDQGYFSDGLSEELLNRLARLEGLRVSGRTSSFYFKGKNEDARVIAETLNVEHLLEGSVRKSGQQLRITTQLLNAATGYQLWSATYDRQLEDVFVVQTEIAEAVAKALSVKLGVGDLAGVEGGTSNIDAYNEYLLGQTLFRQFTRESLPQAIEHFRRATEIAPDYALAWERLADVYLTQPLLFPARSDDWERKSGEAIELAARLAPQAQAVVETMAHRQIHLGQWRAAQRSLANAGLLTSAELLIAVGRGHEAIERLERARYRDPLWGIHAFYLGNAYLQAGRIDEALAEFERAWELGGYPQLISGAGLHAAMSSDNRRVLEIWLARDSENDVPVQRVNVAMADLLGERDESLRWLRDSWANNPSPGLIHVIAQWAAYYEDPVLALEVVRRSAPRSEDMLHFWIPRNQWTPLMSEVRRLPEFKDFAQELGLVAYWREFGWGVFCQPLEGSAFECE